MTFQRCSNGIREERVGSEITQSLHSVDCIIPTVFFQRASNGSQPNKTGLPTGVFPNCIYNIYTRCPARAGAVDEYDAAQASGEVKSNGGARNFSVPKENSEIPSAADIGLTRKDIHEAAKLVPMPRTLIGGRDAVRAFPFLLTDRGLS